ncbi:MAG: PilZ domain-containing protein [Myxococcales bacterium]|nr:PilZ domain-containing protein [Myxococcales bacterium]
MARQSQRLPIDLYVNKIVNGVPHLTRTRDLSREGIFLHRLLEPRVPRDAHVAVEFELPSGELIWTEAEVVYQDAGNGGVGLRFKDMAPRDRRRIDALVAEAA